MPNEFSSMPKIHLIRFTGDTRRDILAGMAMQGLLVKSSDPFMDDRLSEKSIRIADALIAELDNPKDKEC